jgi:hypothetical protein
MGVFDSIEVPDLVVDARFGELEASIDRIFELFNQREQVRATLMTRVEEAVTRLRAIFQSMLDASPQ